MIRDRVVTSTLPPDTRHTVFFSDVSTLPNITAATGTAPAPSATVFWPSISARMAEAISSSLTVTISSTYCWHRAKVRSPGFFTAMPSAMVATLRSSVGPPAWRDRYMDAAPAAWTPTIRHSGFSCFTAKATPPMRPPPPMGTTICSTSGNCSRISRPMVPWPAITRGSLKGWAKV